MNAEHHNMGQPAERQTLTVEEAARLLGIGRNSAYEAVRRGEIPAIRIGKRFVVPRAALERMLSEGRGDGTPYR
jgi:excisionase family DNA binding protein